MPRINIRDNEITCKIVYYGPGLGGKTTNIQQVHQKAHPKFRGKLISLATETDRTLFFDFLPVALRDIGGFKVRFHLFTVPGQVFYEESRRAILNGVDGIVCVADSALTRQKANEESFDDMLRNLKHYGVEINRVPLVIQYNKRDLDPKLDIEDMRTDLNYLQVPDFTAVAVEGEGVIETFREISRLVMSRVQLELLGKEWVRG